MSTTPISKLTTVAGVGIATIALSVALVGCSSTTKTEEAATATSSAEEQTSATDTSAKAAPTPAPKAGSHKTLEDYVKDNNITETVVKQGDPGPTINLPVPDGWKKTDQFPEASYGAIVYPGTQVPDNPPRFLAVLTKLTGTADPEQVLLAAPGELLNLPGYDGPTEGQRDSLAGYDAVQLGGTYDTNGKRGMVAQKTVVIPGQDALYVLQIKGYADESEIMILGDATQDVDEQTTVTPPA